MENVVHYVEILFIYLTTWLTTMCIGDERVISVILPGLRLIIPSLLVSSLFLYMSNQSDTVSFIRRADTDKYKLSLLLFAVTLMVAH